jgi:phage shock protein A
MGIFTRLSDIINSNINSLLDKAEDPEKILRLMVQEMEDTLVELRTAAAKSIAERKERERFVANLQHECADWAAKAELALSKGREDLAKSALVHKSNLSEHTAVVEKEISLISEQLTQLSDDTAKLQAKLADVKARQRTIVMRHQHAENTLRARSQVANQRVEDIMQRFDYAERRIDGLEAQSEALAFGRQKSLAQEIAELETDERITAELEALKARMKSNLANSGPTNSGPINSGSV